MSAKDEKHEHVILLPLKGKNSNPLVVDADDNDQQQDSSPLVKFVQKTFKKRTCKRFLQKTGQNSGLCCCGYMKEKHSLDVKGEGSQQPQQSGQWKAEHDTEESPTDAFGEVEFVISGQKICKYIRVDSKTEVKDLVKLMFDHWQMKRPNLLISVTGGAQSFKMNPRLKEVFRQGLVKAAESTQAWVVTGGTNTGVMKHVGEALRDYTIKHGSKKQLVALGIASWGCIEDKEELISKPSENNGKTYGKWPAVYRAIEPELGKKEAPLDPNHTHFILVDNGTQHSYGVEIKLRTELEEAISNTTTKGEVKIPIVCVVLEGGPNTLETVRNAIDTGVPVIVVEGSGRAADILAYAYKQCQAKDVEYDSELKKRATIAIYDDNLKKKLAERIEKAFNKTDEKIVQNCVANVIACIGKIDHMIIFSLDGNSSAKDIDIMILKALFKVNRDNRIDQLRLALAWNRADIARDEIFTDGVRFEESVLNDLMFSAIVNNRVEFVKLFLEKGINLKSFLTLQRILDIYNDPVAFEKFRHLKKNKKRPPISLKDVGLLIRELNGELFECKYCNDKVKLESEKTKQNRSSMVTDTLKRTSPSEEEASCLFDEPAVDLFIWSILTQRKDMATAFWYESRDDLALAVVGHLLLGSILRRDPDQEFNKELQQQVNHYERLGVSLLSECWSSNQKKTTQLLIRDNPAFGGTTVLKMAVQADNKEFVAHPACQDLLTEIWMGQLSDDNHPAKVLLCIFCPFLAPVWLIYRDEETDSDGLSPSMRQDSIQSPDIQTPTSKYPSQRNLTSVKPGKDGQSLPPQPTSSSSPCVSYFKKFQCFFQAPVVKFAYNCLAYFAFLLLFAVILLTDFYPKIGIKEKILIVWVVTLIFEELRQVAMDDAGDVRLKLYNYITDIWNVLDVITIVMFLAGMILRFIPVPICGQCFYAARIVLAINFMTFFFRILHMFSIHRELGPKLVMIGKMMIDLFFFMMILLVFISAYGIASQVILYPNQDLNTALARDVLRQAWWSIFGEFELEDVFGEKCNDTKLAEAEACASMDKESFNSEQCSAYKEDKCPAIDWLMPVILGIYVVITHVLMLNLLIAMFSNTFNKVHGQTTVVWKMQRYHLVREYDSRPMLPPPLIIFGHIFLLCRYIVRRCCQNCCAQCAKGSTHFRLQLKPNEEKYLLHWENVNAEEVIRKIEIEEAEGKVRDTNERVNSILDKVETISETNFLFNNTSDAGQPQMPWMFEKRFADLDNQMKWTQEALKHIIENLPTSSKQPFKYQSVEEETPQVKQEKEDISNAKIKQATAELSRRMKLHRHAREAVYPKSTGGQSVIRTSVADVLVSFSIDFPDYNPVEFTDESVKKEDIDLKLPVSFDRNNRQTWMTESYRVENGYPLNPGGRTGLRGRGVLKHWGPNYVVNVVITRWKRPIQEEKFLEYVAVQKQNQWSIPEEETEYNNEGPAVQRCFQSLLTNTESAENVLKETRKVVYRGYLDDTRNTDNAWIETITLNYHVQDEKADDSVTIKADDKIKWITIRRDLSLDDSRLRLLSRVAQERKASF